MRRRCAALVGGGAFKPLGGVTIESSWWHHQGRGGGATVDCGGQAG